MIRGYFGMALAAVVVLSGMASAGQTVSVNDSSGLRRALRDAGPGTRIMLAAGEYRGGVTINAVSGTKDAPVVIAGRDPRNLPVFEGGGGVALHLVDCSHVTLRNIRVSGYPGNGINADDGGTYDTPARGLRFENLVIERTGPKGNHDALKLSGLDEFLVRGCTFAGWGGSAIDMVGCHDGTVDRCAFIGLDGFSQANAIQTKGGSARILVHRSFFRNAGQRAINLGGSTGEPYFRPRGANYEATDIEIAGNRFVGSPAPVAWATAKGGRVHHNTIYMPEKWVLRILQEKPTDRYVRCREGVFEHNLVVFDRRVRVFVNIGPHTKPETFTFRHNAWYQADGSRRPRLPAPEQNGIYGIDPKLKQPGTPKMTIESDDPRLQGIGADAYRPKEESQPHKSHDGGFGRSQSLSPNNTFFASIRRLFGA